MNETGEVIEQQRIGSDLTVHFALVEDFYAVYLIITVPAKKYINQYFRLFDTKEEAKAVYDSLCKMEEANE